MKEAIAEAKAGIHAGHGGPFGAVVVKDGRIIGRGHNMVAGTNDPTAHGEISAIRDACAKEKTFDLGGAELFTTCYPCPMCMGASMWAGIKTVYYGCNSEDAAKIGFSDKEFHEFFHSPEKQAAFLKLDEKSLPDCHELFKEYQTIPTRVNYNPGKK